MATIFFRGRAQACAFTPYMRSSCSRSSWCTNNLCALRLWKQFKCLVTIYTEGKSFRHVVTSAAIKRILNIVIIIQSAIGFGDLDAITIGYSLTEIAITARKCAPFRHLKKSRPGGTRAARTYAIENVTCVCIFFLGRSAHDIKPHTSPNEWKFLLSFDDIKVLARASPREKKAARERAVL